MTWKTKKKNIRWNYAFIDNSNVNSSVNAQRWKLDRAKFLKLLQEKFGVTKAYLFIGYTPENSKMYKYFRELGYDIVFKPVLTLDSGQTKWNVDAELVLQAMIDYRKYKRAVIVTGDGDFACLVRHFYNKDKLHSLIVPNKRRYSQFLQDAAFERLKFLEDYKKIVRY